MNLPRLVAACLMVIVSIGISQAEISQHFDRSGRLVPAEKKPSTPQAHKMRKYSVPEGIELRSDVHYEFYPVFGKTFAEIVRSTEENSPQTEKNQKKQPAAYDWNLGWTYDFTFSLEADEDNEKIYCEIMIIDPVLSYDITITLPALTDDSALNPIEKELWKNYVASLLERLQGRTRIIKDDTKDSILRQFSEITYLELSSREAEQAEQIVERFVRSETTKTGSAMIKQIQQKLEELESGTVRDSDAKPATPPPTRRRVPR